jgi:tetratricopeptide (TPR) repeat protein
MTEVIPPVASLCQDQRRRWRRGESATVETYLEQFPGLGSNPDGLLDLIYNEIVLREESGERPRLEEYLGRFGRLGPQLRELFEVHEAIRRGEDGEVPPLPSLASGPPAAPPAVPGYEVMGELGRGGMGVVYRARQTSLNRPVALKMILAPEHAGTLQGARFRAEAEAVARLQHPNIVQVYEVGEQDGRTYFSMELVEGGNLADLIAGSPQPAAESARLVEVLARAIQHAHSRGVVHRDLKPANVLLSAASEPSSPAEDQERGIAGRRLSPKITDFGLAKRIGASAAQTQPGVVVGTPSYMAPEQTGRTGEVVGPAADVYALGAVLYELLTGRPPFKAETPFDTLLQVIHDDPLPPSRLRARTPRDLETVCLKCLQKEPGQRYPSAAALADDLRRFLDGRPVLARPVSAAVRALRWARRRPATAALLVVSTVAVLTLGGLAAWHGARERQRQELVREELEQQFLGEARAALERKEWEGARSRLTGALDRINAEPCLAPYRPRAEHLLAETEDRRHAAETWRDFTRERDGALFARLELLSHGELADTAARREAIETRTRKALAVIALDPDADGPWEPDPRFDESQRAQVVADGATLLLVLADVVAARSGDADALRLLDRAARIRPRSRAVCLRRAACRRSLGDESGAGEEERQAANLAPASAHEYFLLGDEQYRRRDLPAALRAFESAVAVQADHFWAAFCLARCYADLKEWDKARASLTVCLVARPDVVWAHLLRGYVHREMGAFDAAEIDFGKAATLLDAGDDPEARFALHLNRGLLRWRQGRTEEAMSETVAAARVRRDSWEPHLNLARMYEQSEQTAAAEKEIRLALARRPPPLVLADYHAGRARDLYEEGKYEESAAECRASLKQRDDLPLALGYLGQALLRLGRYEEAARSFTLYLEKGGRPVADSYRGRGFARMKQGDYLGARDDYTRVVLAEPGAEIFEHRGWAYFFADAWQPALRDFDEALRLDPRRPDAYTGRGLARVMLGRYREAVRDADEALRRKPSTPEMMHNLACVFAQASARAEADAAPDRGALAAGYRERAIDAVRQSLALLPAEGRAGFLRDSVVPDPALAPVRQEPAFWKLLDEFGLRRAPR